MNQSDDAYDPVLDTKQAAAYLGTTRANLTNSRSTGLLFGVATPKFIVASRKRLYRLSELNRFLDEFGAYQNNTDAHLSGNSLRFPFRDESSEDE